MLHSFTCVIVIYLYKISDYAGNLSQFTKNRNTTKEILKAKRGTIYDVNGEALAQNVYSYTLIAYLSPFLTNKITSSSVIEL